MRALVTGGAGFIGSHLVDALVDLGADVVVLDDLSSGRAENVSQAADFFQADIRDKAAVDDAIAGCDLVFHQAARRAVLQSIELPLETDRVNVGGTLTVLVAARDAGVSRVVFGAVVERLRRKRHPADARVRSGEPALAVRGHEVRRRAVLPGVRRGLRP